MVNKVDLGGGVARLFLSSDGKSVTAECPDHPDLGFTLHVSFGPACEEFIKVMINHYYLEPAVPINVDYRVLPPETSGGNLSIDLGDALPNLPA